MYWISDEKLSLVDGEVLDHLPTEMSLNLGEKLELIGILDKFCKEFGCKQVGRKNG